MASMERKTRKRARAASVEDKVDDEQSPAPASTRKTKLLKTVKRQKINHEATPVKTTSNGNSSLLRRLGTMVGLGGSAKGNDTEQGKEAADELAGDDIWEIDTRSDEDIGKKRQKKDGSVKNSGRKKTREPTPKPAETYSKEVADDDLWKVDMTSDEDWSRRNGGKIKVTAKNAKVLTTLPAERASRDAAARLSGARKAENLLKAKELSQSATKARHFTNENRGNNKGESEEEVAEAETPSHRRRSGRSTKATVLNISDAVSDDGTIIRKEKVDNMVPRSTHTSTRIPKLRGRPKLSRVLESAKSPPKGILTPNKPRAVGRPRKSVVFDASGQDDLKGFEDLPSSVPSKKQGRKPEGPAGTSIHSVERQSSRRKKDDEDGDLMDVNEPVLGKSRRGRKPKVGAIKEIPASYSEDGSDVEAAEEVAEEVEEEKPKRGRKPKSQESTKDSTLDEVGDDEEEAKCVICQGLESEAPNKILLCSNEECEYAIHQLCGNIPKIPKGDWYCKNCKIEGFDQHLRNMQRALLDRLTGQKRIKLRGHDEEMQKVHQLVEQTVLAGEGNSMLVIGARGCGKTTLVESVISDLSKGHREKFHVVRLNGFIHTDDKLALRDIWRQLGREMEVEDDLTGKANNYADTLASLLALLSHPSEISEADADQTAKSVIFVLDEFDLFTTHSRQTLLYNLFDIAQARKAPIAVLGLTTRVDVVESLEKRVKSRFSHRYVHLSLPKSIPAFWEICKEGLLIDDEDLEAEGFSLDTPGQSEFVSTWQLMIEDLYTKDPDFKQLLQSHFYRSKSAPALFTSCILAIANLSAKNFPLSGQSFNFTSTLSAPDSKLHMLQGLSDLELALLIAAARLDIILDTDTCNFAMAYDEYSSLTSAHKIQTSSTGVTALGGSAKVWSRDVALGAWERLVEYELLIPAAIGGGTGHGGAGVRMWKLDVGLEEIAGSVEGLPAIMVKWCSTI